MPEAPKSLLVLDDESDALDLMRFIFEPRGYDVHTTAEGEEALAILSEREIAVVLVDLLMPSMSGPEFLARMEQLPEKRRPVVLVHSARRPEEIESATEGFDVFDILHKPFEISEVTGMVDRARESRGKRSGPSS
jgi:CheY-like chemotaxis protein